MAELIGARLGDFEIVCELGRGGMGVVYEARQVSQNRRAALKVLGPGLGMTPKAVDCFRREAAAAAKLHHTNIVRVYATGGAPTSTPWSWSTGPHSTRSSASSAAARAAVSG
jgi:serine/threonine protein kinase